MQQIKLSIIVTYYYNRIEQFKRCINSLYFQRTNYNSIELLLLNDGGSKDIIDLLRKYSGKFSIKYFHLFKKQQNYSNSASRRNFLVRQSTGKYILITDPEMVHYSNTLQQTLNAFEKYGDKIWYCGRVYGTKSMVLKNGDFPYHRRKDTDTNSFLGKEPVTQEKLDLRFLEKSQSFFSVNPHKFTAFFWCTGITKSLYERVYGCNEDMSIYGYEETDLFKRLTKLGVRRVYDSSFISYHLPHAISLSPAEQRFWYSYNEFIPFQKKADWGKLSGELVKEIHI